MESVRPRSRRPRRRRFTAGLATAFHQAPALGDIDRDGDLDLLLGTWNDGVLVFRNEAGRFVQDTSATIRFARGSNFIPALGDLDGDGDLDLLVGEASGELNMLENEAGRFTLKSELYENIDAGRRSAPALADLDGDGDLDLVIGSEVPGSVYYENVGSRMTPSFVKRETVELDLPSNAAPILVDIDADGNVDAFSGTLAGGIVFWRYSLRR